MYMVIFFLVEKSFFVQTYKIDFSSGIFGIIKLLLVQFYILSLNDKWEHYWSEITS